MWQLSPKSRKCKGINYCRLSVYFMEAGLSGGKFQPQRGRKPQNIPTRIKVVNRREEKFNRIQNERTNDFKIIHPG